MSDELVLRQAIPADAEDLMEFYQTIQDYPYIDASSVITPAEIIANNLAEIYESTVNNIVLAINDEKIIGFCNVDHGELGIVIEQDFWHFGVGSELMYDTLMWFEKDSDLEELVLEVYKENKPAIGLYEKFGFTMTKETETTILMYKKR